MPLVSDGLLFGALTEKQKENVLDLVGDLAAQRFKAYVDAIIQAFDFRAPRTQAEKMALYRGRMQGEWGQMAQQDPKEYKKQLDEWVRMERFNSFIRLHPRQGGAAMSGLPVSQTSNVV